MHVLRGNTGPSPTAKDDSSEKASCEDSEEGQNRMQMWGYPRKNLVLVSLGICILYPYLLFAGNWPRDVQFNSRLAMRDTIQF